MAEGNYLKGVKLADGTTATFGEVRYNEEQQLSEEQKARARDNIGAASVDQSGGGSLEPLIVTMNDSMDEASHNFEQISSHVDAGGDVFFDSLVGHIALNDLSYTEGVAIFAKVGGSGVNIFEVNSDGSLYLRNATWATADQIGDISSALDELHTYAQGLINGGATE